MNTSMLYSHLKLAWRNIHRHRFFSTINIVGLSCTIAFVILTFLFIRNEQAFDQFHSKKESIFRLYHQAVNPENDQSMRASAVTAIPLGRDLAERVAEITHYTRIASTSTTILKENEPFDEVIHFVDTGFLKMFDFPIVDGSRSGLLEKPHEILISIDMAEKYFGAEEAIGRELQVIVGDTMVPVSVSAVINNRRNESSIAFDFLMPMEQYQLAISETTYNSYNYGLVENYIQLVDDRDIASMESLLTETLEPILPVDEERIEFGLQPLSEIHFEHEIVGNASYTNPQKLYYMLALAILVVVIACINFITLMTSQLFGRLKEVGVRKALGAMKGQLRRQLIFENFLNCLAAGIIGLLLAWTMAPIFHQLLDSQFRFSIGASEVIFILAVMILIAAVTGGLLSSVILSKETSDALVAKQGSARNNWQRDGLIILQFTLSIMLIIGALTMRQQMQYVQNKDLGFDQDRLLEISMPSLSDLPSSTQLIERFATMAQQHQNILVVSASMNNAREPWTQLVFEQSGNKKEQLFYNQVGSNYLKTMDIELVGGTDFAPDLDGSSQEILVNESLVRHFGWEDPLGEQIPGMRFERDHRIIGVVEDFHFSSLHKRIEPLILARDERSILSGVTGLNTYVWPPNLYQIIVRLGPGSMAPAIQYLEDTWKSLVPQKAFTHHFTDEVLASKYAEEKRWGQALHWASLFAVGIAWLGLVSLLQLTLRRKTKEIGIRKVLGSSSFRVSLLLIRRYFWLVLCACLLAWPVAWFTLGRWLESFSYRINLNPLFFVLIGVSVLSLTILTMGLQSHRAARANPINALKEQ